MLFTLNALPRLDNVLGRFYQRVALPLLLSCGVNGKYLELIGVKTGFTADRSITSFVILFGYVDATTVDGDCGVVARLMQVLH